MGIFSHTPEPPTAAQLQVEQTSQLEERRTALRERQRSIAMRRDALLPVINRPKALENQAAQLQRVLDLEKSNPSGISFEVYEARRKEAHELAQEALKAQPAGEQAAADLKPIEAELAAIGEQFKELAREEALGRRMARLKRILPLWEQIEQEQLDEERDAFREDSLWTGPAPGPFGVAIDHSHSVAAFIRYQIARHDGEFAKTLSDDDPARRKLALAREAGPQAVPVPIVFWR